MEAFALAALLIVVSIVVVALALRRGDRGRAGVEPGMVRRAFHFAGGPFPLSVALHLAGLLFLIITVHETRGRDLVMVNLEPGGGGGSGSKMDDLDVPDVPMPEVAPQSMEAPQAADLNQAVKLANNYVRAAGGGGIGIGRGGGVGTGNGPGIGPGSFGEFIGRIRRQGLDVVLVIDGTNSMSMVMDDVKARMAQIVQSIHRLVPTARVGIVVYGGAGEPVDVQPLTLSPAKLEAFLSGIQTKGGGEWEENLGGAMQTAVEHMDWRPYARKVIVMVGDAPPKANELASLIKLAGNFRNQNGIINTIDVTAQEHERFEREFAIRVHRTEPAAASPLPAFYQQTRAAYLALARAGGGSMKSLEGDDRINQQVLMLAFGDNWAQEVSRFAPAETAKK